MSHAIMFELELFQRILSDYQLITLLKGIANRYRLLNNIQ